jgi:pyridoxine 5-phosphate synthase
VDTSILRAFFFVPQIVIFPLVRPPNFIHEELSMATLGVNIDHIATLRQARGGGEPDPVQAAMLAELAGAHGITAHLREDRRHIQDRDIHLLKQTVATHLNLEMACTEPMVALALELRPWMVTLVPEKRAERTTEGGLDVIGQEKEFLRYVKKIRDADILVSTFIAPDRSQVEASKRIGATHIELHTGFYSNAAGSQVAIELEKISAMASLANGMGLRVNAGHGLNYHNVGAVAAVKFIEELNIGHSIISRASLVGMDRAVRDMLALLSA